MKKLLTIFLTATLLFCSLPKIDLSFAESTGYTLNWFADNGKMTLISINGSGDSLVIPDTVQGFPVVTIANDVGINFDEIVNLTLPSSLISIGSNAFSNCDLLQNITIPDSVTTIEKSAFQNCKSLKSVSIGAGLSSIEPYAFTVCSSLTNFNVSSENLNYISTGKMLFDYNLTTLVRYAGKDTSITIPSSVKHIAPTAFFCSSFLTNIKLPENLVSIGNYSFAGCINLKELILPDTLSSIGESCFLSCVSLTKVVFGDLIKTIPNDCFYLCSSLNDITFPKELEVIGEDAFSECVSLKSIVLPKTITSIKALGLGFKYNSMEDKNVLIDDVVVYGYADSYAEIYTKNNGITFVDIGNVLIGDVNQDGIIDSFDASMVLLEYSNISSAHPTEFSFVQKLAYDFNSDNIIDSFDASLILNFYAKASSGK